MNKFVFTIKALKVFSYGFIFSNNGTSCTTKGDTACTVRRILAGNMMKCYQKKVWERNAYFAQKT